MTRQVVIDGDEQVMSALHGLAHMALAVSGSNAPVSVLAVAIIEAASWAHRGIDYETDLLGSFGHCRSERGTYGG